MHDAAGPKLCLELKKAGVKILPFPLVAVAEIKVAQLTRLRLRDAMFKHGIERAQFIAVAARSDVLRMQHTRRGEQDYSGLNLPVERCDDKLDLGGKERVQLRDLLGR